MLMNRILPLILLLVISRSAAAEDAFWVMGSFVNADVARVEGSRISSDAGIEVLLFESIVNARVQYRLLTGVLVEPSDQAQLRQQLMEIGVPDPWTLRFDDGTPFMETVFPDLGTDDALSASELAEIDSMSDDFDEEYAEDTGTNLMDTDITIDDIGAGTDSTLANYVIIGSYGTAQNAKDYASKLGRRSPEILSHEMTVRSGEVFGETVYRVMVGPLLASEEKGVMASLSELGIQGAWLLRGVPALAATSVEGQSVNRDQSQKPNQNLNQNPNKGQDRNQDISQPQRGFRVPGQPGSRANVAPAKSSLPQGGFNPVRLRKDPANFPDPRDKR